MISQVLRSPLRNDTHTGTCSCHRNWLQIVFPFSLCADMPRCLETVSDLDLTISSGHNIQYHMRCYSLLRVCARFEEELWALVRGNETVYTHIILNRSFEKTGVIDQSELIITCFLFVMTGWYAVLMKPWLEIKVVPPTVQMKLWLTYFYNSYKDLSKCVQL